MIIIWLTLELTILETVNKFNNINYSQTRQQAYIPVVVSVVVNVIVGVVVIVVVGVVVTVVVGVIVGVVVTVVVGIYFSATIANNTLI